MTCSTARPDRARRAGRRRALARRRRAATTYPVSGPAPGRKRPSARRHRSAASTTAHRSNSVCEATNPATTGSPPTYTPVTAAPIPWIGLSQFAHANPTRIPPIIAAICPTVKSQPNRSFASRCAGAGFTSSPPSVGRGWSCGARSRVPPFVASPGPVARRRRRRGWAAAGRGGSPDRRLGALAEPGRRPAALGERLRSDLGARRGQRADRLALVRRPLAERLVGQMLPRARPLVGDQAPHRAPASPPPAQSRACLACSADTGWCCSRSDASSISASKSSCRQLGRCRPPPPAATRALRAGERRRRVRARVPATAEPSKPPRLMLRRTVRRTR